jgi:hypothetical protein
MCFVSVHRENDEEVGLGEVDERVSMLMVCHLQEAYWLCSCMCRCYSMSGNAETCKTN